MTALVIGSTGQVGYELARRLATRPGTVVTSRTGECPVAGVRCVELDASDLSALAQCIRTVRPSVVLNASAYTAVDRAETEAGIAHRVNAEAPAAMAAACREIGARLVHFSTDYVFDGSATTPYREDSATAPLGVYGRTKLEGENAIRDSEADHLIVRTAWVYGPRGHNFFRTMLRLAAERDELRVVDDQVGCPTPAHFIADATLQLIEAGASGFVNVVTTGSTSWCGFARAVVEGAAARRLISASPRITPIPTSGYPTPAQRPAFSVLETSRLKGYGIDIPNWRQGLASVFDALECCS